MAEELRVLAILLENTGLVSLIHNDGSQQSVLRIQGDWMNSLGLCRHQAGIVHIHIFRQNNLEAILLHSFYFISCPKFILWLLSVKYCDLKFIRCNILAYLSWFWPWYSEHSTRNPNKNKQQTISEERIHWPAVRSARCRKNFRYRDFMGSSLMLEWYLSNTSFILL